MKYKIVRTNDFYNDFYNAFYYIRYKLDNQKAAIKLKNTLIKCLDDLQIVAAACKTINIKSKNKYRKYYCGNYLIIFSINEEFVVLQHFYYAKSDIKNRLKD